MTKTTCTLKANFDAHPKLAFKLHRPHIKNHPHTTHTPHTGTTIDLHTNPVEINNIMLILKKTIIAVTMTIMTEEEGAAHRFSSFCKIIILLL